MEDTEGVMDGPTQSFTIRVKIGCVLDSQTFGRHPSSPHTPHASAEGSAGTWNWLLERRASYGKRSGRSRSLTQGLLLAKIWFRFDARCSNSLKPRLPVPERDRD
jgi:hypothetical protein